MNCQHISRTLDSRDVNALSATERSDCEAHAAVCPHCAPTWVVYTRLAAIPVPAMSADFVARCEKLVAAQGRVTNFRRRPGRVVLLGSILVLAAAAAMFSMHLLNRHVVTSTAPAVAPPAVGPAVETLVAAATLPPVADQLADAEARPEPTAPPIAPFTVRVLPLQNDETDPAGKAAIAATYEAFVDRLRTTPGVTLVETGPDSSAPQAHAEYRITMNGISGSSSAGGPPAFGGEFNAEILTPEGRVARGMFGGYSVEVAPGCVTDPKAMELELSGANCKDAAGVAANLVGQLRKTVFPPDPSLLRELQARLLNRSLGEKQRETALLDLSYFGSVNVGLMAHTAVNSAMSDPAVIRGAAELASSAGDPAVRANAWNLLRGISDAELISPLLVALSRDPGAEVRLAALGVLTGNFAEDPRVQAAFKAAAEREAQPLVRALVRRAAHGAEGAAGWKQYVRDSLKDSSRPAVERIEALFYEMNLPVTALYRKGNSTVQPAIEMLDDDSVRSLAEVLPRAAAESPVIQRSLNELLRSLGNLSRPAAVTDLLVAMVESGFPSVDRVAAVEALGQSARHQQNQRAYAALQKLAADPDARVREVAAVALQARSSAPQPRPARQLGADMTSMQAGPDVPEELVGKPLVRIVAPGSIAEVAGLKTGDVLLEVGFNGRRIEANSRVASIFQSIPEGMEIELLVLRLGQKVSLVARF
jgi:hypothetical protein